MFDIDLIKNFYQNLDNQISEVRKIIDRPLTLSEKILYSHVDNNLKLFYRGIDYVNFNPDRVAMQDATAQMALLQFMIAETGKVAVPCTVHCDHLIQAKINSDQDLKNALDMNSEVYKFLSSASKFAP